MITQLKPLLKAGITAFLVLPFLFSCKKNMFEKAAIQPSHKFAGTAAISSFATIASVDAVVKEEMAKQNITGIAVGVVQNGNITHLNAYGHTNESRTIAMTTSTVLRWASISKVVTAVAAFKAIEQGKMISSDKVTKHVSYWPTTGTKGAITIAQLLSHRAGILHYGYGLNDVKICSYNRLAYTAVNNFNAEQCVNVFKNCDLAFQPGTNYLYSTFGFNLVGAAVEGATGKPYEVYVDDNILDKAGMSSMTGYSNDPGGFTKDCNTFIKPITEGSVEWKLPGGGWASNINDMAKFMKGLINGTFLNNTAALWATVPGNSSYCSGIFKESLPGTNKIHVYHGGAHDDVRTYLGFFPADNTGVCLMINSGLSVNAERLGKLIENALGYTWPVDNSPIDYSGDDNACGQRMFGVWRNTGNADNIVLRRGYTTAEFHEEYEILKSAGYYADNIETWMDGLVRKWDGIFKKTTKSSAMWRDFTSDAWHDKWVEMSNQGYRLIDLETYMDGAVRKWAGTFIMESGGYAMYRDLSTDDFGKKYTELQAQNLKLIDIETYMDGLNRKWAGVWKGSGTSLLNRNYNEADFLNLCTQRANAGYKLIDVETYMDGLNRKWAGVWEIANDQQHFIINKKMGELINNYHNVYKAQGYELVDIETY